MFMTFVRARLRKEDGCSFDSYTGSRPSHVCIPASRASILLDRQICKAEKLENNEQKSKKVRMRASVQRIGRSSQCDSLTAHNLPHHHPSPTTAKHGSRSSIMSSTAIVTTDLPLKLIAKGKVRDVYDAGLTQGPHAGAILFVATDRISAFDIILQNVSTFLLSASRLTRSRTHILTRKIMLFDGDRESPTRASFFTPSPPSGSVF